MVARNHPFLFLKKLISPPEPSLDRLGRLTSRQNGNPPLPFLLSVPSVKDEKIKKGRKKRAAISSANHIRPLSRVAAAVVCSTLPFQQLAAALLF